MAKKKKHFQGDPWVCSHLSLSVREILVQFQWICYVIGCIFRFYGDNYVVWFVRYTYIELHWNI